MFATQCVRVAALTALLFSTLSHADCSRPDAPAIPDGSKATKEQMIEGQQAVKAYMAGTNQYLECLTQQSKDSAETDTDETKAVRLQSYNAAVTDMEEVAASFNGEIKKWKAQGAE